MTSLTHEENKLTQDQEKRKLLVMKVQVIENNSIFRFSGFTEYLPFSSVWWLPKKPKCRMGYSFRGQVYCKENCMAGKNTRGLRKDLEGHFLTNEAWSHPEWSPWLSPPLQEELRAPQGSGSSRSEKPTCPAESPAWELSPEEVGLAHTSYQQADGKRSQPDKEASRSQG